MRYFYNLTIVVNILILVVLINLIHVVLVILINLIHDVLIDNVIVVLIDNILVIVDLVIVLVDCYVNHIIEHIYISKARLINLIYSGSCLVVSMSNIVVPVECSWVHIRSKRCVILLEKVFIKIHKRINKMVHIYQYGNWDTSIYTRIVKYAVFKIIVTIRSLNNIFG